MVRIHLVDFPPISHRLITAATSCLHSYISSQFFTGLVSKAYKWQEANAFLSVYTPTDKGGKIITDSCKWIYSPKRQVFFRQSSCIMNIKWIISSQLWGAACGNPRLMKLLLTFIILYKRKCCLFGIDLNTITHFDLFNPITGVFITAISRFSYLYILLLWRTSSSASLKNLTGRLKDMPIYFLLSGDSSLGNSFSMAALGNKFPL